MPPAAWQALGMAERAREGHSQAQIADELLPVVENILDELDRWLNISAPQAQR